MNETPQVNKVARLARKAQPEQVTRPTEGNMLLILSVPVGITTEITIKSGNCPPDPPEPGTDTETASMLKGHAP